MMRKKNKSEYQIIHDDEIDIKALWMVLWTSKLELVKITSAFFVLGILYLFFSTTLYYSNASIVQTEAEASSSMSSMLSLASSVGMDVGSATASPEVSVIDFVHSRRMQDALLEQTWVTSKSEEVNLISYWDISDTTGMLSSIIRGVSSLLGLQPKSEEEIRIKWFDAGRRILGQRINARYTETGLLMVEGWMEDPKLTRDITAYVVQAIIDFTNEVKDNRWKNNIDFLTTRLKELKVELMQAEDNYTDFQKENRRISDSPELMIEMANLRRDMEIKTQLYLSLQNEYEFARVEEAKDITGIFVLDPAFYPVEPSKPQKLGLLIASIVVGFILSLPGYLVYRAIKQ